MPVVDVIDETFLAVEPARVAAAFADPAAWPRLWPDLRLQVFADRGVEGVRWSVSGRWTGSMEVWVEPVLDGAVLHYFLRLDPAVGTPVPGARAAAREAIARQRTAKRIAFALRDRLDPDRPPGLPPAHACTVPTGGSAAGPGHEPPAPAP